MKRSFESQFYQAYQLPVTIIRIIEVITADTRKYYVNLFQIVDLPIFVLIHYLARRQLLSAQRAL